MDDFGGYHYFRKPPMYLLSILSFRVGCWCFRGFRWVEVETWSHHVQSVGVYFVNLSLGGPASPQRPKPETLGGGCLLASFFVAASEEMRFGRCRDQDEVFFLNYPPVNDHILPFFQNTSESMIFRNPRLVGYEGPIGRQKWPNHLKRKMSTQICHRGFPKIWVFLLN